MARTFHDFSLFFPVRWQHLRDKNAQLITFLIFVRLSVSPISFQNRQCRVALGVYKHWLTWWMRSQSLFVDLTIFLVIIFLRLCSVMPQTTWIRGDWERLNLIQIKISLNPGGRRINGTYQTRGPHKNTTGRNKILLLSKSYRTFSVRCCCRNSGTYLITPKPELHIAWKNSWFWAEQTALFGQHTWSSCLHIYPSVSQKFFFANLCFTKVVILIIS
jgi:hypothetical protein